MGEQPLSKAQKSTWMASGIAIGTLVASMFQIQFQIPIKLDLATRIVGLKTRQESVEVRPVPVCDPVEATSRSQRNKLGGACP
ncbi:hypothetical protein Pan216_21080 [Planctomycetes bacterium Pan216]|uniref:Uncharacterized protein n=1 Tax=Kolteria novifilia TaxID=2527975 RepID=A0A518B2U0_9BACT|nr:hypothetical protein Pan216_21080 [Planctomycetes bacterium Pan216]